MDLKTNTKKINNSQMHNSPRVCIIVLNWNGWRDTVECAESILNQRYPEYQLVIIDNGSSDDSVTQIKHWINDVKHIKFMEYCRTEAEHGDRMAKKDKVGVSPSKALIILITTGENLGFAVGNNIGINHALKSDFKYFFILNNDTIIKPDTVSLLVAALETEKKYGVATPQIRYYDEPGRIVNSGGYLTITGHRKYYNAGRLAPESSEKSVREISFITGCALFVRREIFEKYGILSEDFFFGEEDYEFSLRMRKNHVGLVCILNAHVYHKIGRARKTLCQNINSIFMHYFNRFVNYRKYYRKFYWYIWRFGTFAYILPMLYIKYKFTLEQLVCLARTLIKYSNDYNAVSKQCMNQAFEELTKC